jgi:hypothetical protein
MIIHRRVASSSSLSLLSMALCLAAGLTPRQASAVQLFRYDFSTNTDPSSLVSGLTATPITSANLSTTIFSNVYQTSGYSSALDTSQYFEFTATANSGKVLNLSDLKFTPLTPSQENAVVASVRSSVDNYTTAIYSRSIPSDSFFFNETIDLTGAQYQGLSSITFRYYGTSPSTSTILYYDAVNLNGTVATVPEPATCAMALVGLACGGLSMFRRKHKR